MPRSFILPGQPTRYARSHNFNIDKTKLEIELNFEQKSIKGKVVHTIEPVGRSIDSIELDSADLSINSVKVKGDKISGYQTKSQSIWIPLGFDFEKGSKAEVELEYSGTPKRGLYFRAPSKEFPHWKVHAFTQGQSEDSKFWFPCYDYPNMRTATEMLITVPSNMIVVSNGKLISEPRQENGKKTWHFIQEVPHSSYLTSIVAGEFKNEEEMHNGVLLQYVYPEGRDEEAKRSFGNTPRMIDFFSRVTGERYPYPKYSQSAVSDFMYGGMENITATTLTDRTFHDERAHLDFTSDNLVAHELAHQWFGDLLTCKDWSHAWLNEGFANYFTALWREYDQGFEDFQYYMYSPYMDGLVDELDRYHRAIVTKRYWDADELFDSHTYEKGAWVLNGIRGVVGDDIFFKAIKNYVAKHKNSNVETTDFRKVLEEVSGQDLEYFFDQWVYSPGFPEYSASYDWNNDQKLAELEIEQTNSETDGTPLFTSPIEIRFTFKDGSKVSKLVKMNDKKCSFFFYLENPPLNVNIDPKNWVLKRLKFCKPKEMHLYQLQNDENAMERIRAAHELESFQTNDVIEALSKSVDSDKFWAVQLEAAKALGKMGTKASLTALLERVNHKDHRTRRGIAHGLRGFANLDPEDREKAIDALVKILQNDEAYFARGYAAWSLGFHKGSDKAFEAMKMATSQESINDIVRFRVFYGFWEMDDPRAIPIAIDQLDHGKWHQGRMLAAFCLGKIGKGDPRTSKALLGAERIPNVYVRDEAATALGTLGDASLIGDIEAWLSREPEGRTRRRLRESIHLLKEKVIEVEKLSKLNTDLEKLASDSKTSEAKINALEAKIGR
ncbi:MAG: M1 family aminopeptidase [archaeon]|nr:M1 family aminopeptidase [archaeon]